MWHVAFLGVHPNHQGNGCGKQLLKEVANWAKMVVEGK
jgi:GNAT superfamily N-acetyltransferase